MDYTLAVYNSPEYESLAYDLLKERLIKTGYPESIRTLKYDPQYPIRGLFLDKEFGNLLKVDSFGNIVLCLHGRHKLPKKRVSELYPSMYIHSDQIGNRFKSLNTLFDLPEACIYGDLVEHLETYGLIEISPVIGEKNLSYSHLAKDIRAAMDVLHEDGQIKSETLRDLPKYIKKTPNLAVLLERLKTGNKKLFLLTNSEYFYTDAVMTYLLGSTPKFPVWRDYFDVIMVFACKPNWFSSGTSVRQIDLSTGNLMLSGVQKQFIPGNVYQGGSLNFFSKLTGATGNNVLYIGDHIFADIIKSKKSQGWRKFTRCSRITS